ncbi:MAG: dihydroorotate dehydrogenase electron transfer subunit [Saccharofermentanales bacterium]|jgi:dihydroorotate dehydrogenase electron transfer subunit
MCQDNKPLLRHQGKLLRNEQLSDSTNLLTIKAPEPARTARPGQFVQLKTSHYLRRPIGLMSVDREQGLIQLGIRRVGPGSNELCDLEPGITVDLVGPLGTGFDLGLCDDGACATAPAHLVTVGGGTGLFPLIYLLEEAVRQGITTTAIIGFRSPAEAILQERMRATAKQCIFASDTGGLDFTGHAGEALTSVLDTLSLRAEQLLVCACGPVGLLENIALQCLERKIQCQVSLEARMACGIGVCVGCSIPVYQQDRGTKTADSETTYERCCYDGPVFPAARIVWPSQGGIW